MASSMTDSITSDPSGGWHWSRLNTHVVPLVRWRLCGTGPVLLRSSFKPERGPGYTRCMDALRKRLKRREREGGCRFLTFSCYKRLSLLSTAPMRDLMARSIGSARIWCRFELLAWVVMPEHLHMMIRPNVHEFTVDVICKRIKRPVATRAVDRWRRLGARVLPQITTEAGNVQFWQAGGGYDRNPRNEGDVLKHIKYIHHNPVKRGLVERAIDWPWSSARWYNGDTTGVVAIDPLPPNYEWMWRAIVAGLHDSAPED